MGTLTDTPGRLNNAFFVNLLDMGTTWEASDVCVHIEAPDEASHEGRHDAKIEALQQIDTHIVGPIREALSNRGDHRILVTPAPPTFCRTKKHTHGPVPLAMAGMGIDPDAATTYDEPAAATGRHFDRGWDLMGSFIGSHR